MIDYDCDWCGEQASKYPAQYNEDGHNFCGRDCYLEFHDNSETFICDHCDGEFERAVSQVRGERMFCSYKCRSAWMSENRRGEDSWNWDGGIAERESVEYDEWRSAVLERDGYTCQDCESVGGTLVAHHIERWSDAPDRGYDTDNGVTLCPDCHADRHEGETVETLIRKSAQ